MKNKIILVLITLLILNTVVVYGITVDGNSRDWSGVPSKRDMNNDASNETEDINTLYWFSDDQNIYLGILRKNYFLKATGNEYKQYEGYQGEKIDTDYGYTKLIHSNKSVEHIYDANYIIELYVSGGDDYRVYVEHDVFNETLNITCESNGRVEYRKTYRNMAESNFTELIIPLSVLNTGNYGGYEIDFMVYTNSDDTDMVTITSTPTMGTALSIISMIAIFFIIRKGNNGDLDSDRCNRINTSRTTE